MVGGILVKDRTRAQISRTRDEGLNEVSGEGERG